MNYLELCILHIIDICVCVYVCGGGGERRKGRKGGRKGGREEGRKEERRGEGREGGRGKGKGKQLFFKDIKIIWMIIYPWVSH